MEASSVKLHMLPSTDCDATAMGHPPHQHKIIEASLLNRLNKACEGSGMDILSLIGRENELFGTDIAEHETDIGALVKSASFLVIGGAGSIGQAVVKEIFKRDPRQLHVVDISENNLVELVRDIRSTLGYGSGEFRTFAIDCGGIEFEALMDASNGYDYVFNLSALKHVRSEKDPFTLMRLTTVNVFNAVKSICLSRKHGATKYFCVSTDKAANPVNMMGASKRIMEHFLFQESLTQKVSMARFANVAFSDGSLLHGFNQRLAKRQPITAPSDIRRYFVTPQESGELCLLSALTGDNRDIYFPKLSEKLHLASFADIAVRFLEQQGYHPYFCESEEQARRMSDKLISERKWPCYFFESDTTGEKEVEEFFTEGEALDLARFSDIGVIKNFAPESNNELENFLSTIEELKRRGKWSKQEIVDLYCKLIPEFHHVELGKNLDQRM